MEEVKVFLESSSIHGLAHILKSRYRVIKVSWLLIATAGFTGAGMLIFESFQEWEENPITTNHNQDQANYRDNIAKSHSVSTKEHLH